MNALAKVSIGQVVETAKPATSKTEDNVAIFAARRLIDAKVSASDRMRAAWQVSQAAIHTRGNDALQQRLLKILGEVAGDAKAEKVSIDPNGTSLATVAAEAQRRAVGAIGSLRRSNGAHLTQG